MICVVHRELSEFLIDHSAPRGKHLCIVKYYESTFVLFFAHKPQKQIINFVFEHYR